LKSSRIEIFITFDFEYVDIWLAEDRYQLSKLVFIEG
jgi:hypothetical protein